MSIELNLKKGKMAEGFGRTTEQITEKVQMQLSEQKKKISFNLSPTSLNLFMQSPLLFYLTYIAKVPDDTSVPVCYGLSGNLVHGCLEKYANKELDRDSALIHFLSEWDRIELDNYLTIQNEPLNKHDYLMALLKGMNIVDSHENHICEEMIQLPFIENDLMKINLKGIIDLQANRKGDNQPILMDYKTSNSVDQGKAFERQAMFYNLLVHKKKGIIPSRTVFHYLKLGVPKAYSFSKEDLIMFEEELKEVANRILEYGTDITNYPIGEIDDLFNSKRQACLKEITRRTLLFKDGQLTI